MDDQLSTGKHLPLNTEHNEGRLVLPGCQLLIKYVPPEQSRVTIGEVPASWPLTTNRRIEELQRIPKKTNFQDAQVAKLQRELIKLLRQMPEMENPINRNKLFPLEFRKSRSGLMGLGGNFEADLNIIIDKSDSIDILNSTIIQAMHISQSEILRERLKELHISLVYDKLAQKENRRKGVKNLDAPHSKLLELLKLTFDEEELRDLCYHLEIDYANLAGQSKSGKARELIHYLQRRKRIPELIDYCKKRRPKEDWPSADHWVS